jgi:hypothetical protein
MDLLFPIPARVSKVTPSIISNTAAARSIFSGASRTLGRSGDRFGFDITVTSANDRQAYPLRAALRNLRAGLRGQANRLWFADPSYSPRGSFPTGELLPNGSFTAAAAGWVTTNAALTVADGFARVQNSIATPGYVTNFSPILTSAGAAYVVRALLYPGNQAAWEVNGGTTLGAGDVFASGVVSAQGLFIWGFNGSGGSSPTIDSGTITIDSSITLDADSGSSDFFLSLLCGTSAAADFVHYLYASVSRCAVVNGGSQTGPNLNISALPASTAGLLLPGDRVQIGTQINTVAAPLNSDGSGDGYLQCTLPWRVSPASGGPIIIFSPMARCILTDNSGSWDESPGQLADFEFVLEESLDA